MFETKKNKLKRHSKYNVSFISYSGNQETTPTFNPNIIIQ